MFSLLKLPSTVALALSSEGAPAIFGVRIEFILFAITLLSVALFHHHTLKVALTGVTIITLYKIVMTGFDDHHTHEHIAGVAGWVNHLNNEWVTVSNLFLLLVGFAILARHFEESEVPHVIPKYLPDDWKGPLMLLVLVFVMSAFLDNIAAALIGGTVAATVFKRKVHIGYLAAIVAASNAGGAGSVVGDTTTTMMWIDGVSPLDILHAFIAAGVALVILGYFGAKLQHAYQPIQKDANRNAHVNWKCIGVVAWILVLTVGTNVVVNNYFTDHANAFPWLGVAVWTAILLAIPVRKPEWSLVPDAVKGSVFLLSLVLSASMMPVEELPGASWQTALGLGFVSSFFDNIPLTALALKQGGYDWGVLAYAVGYGGSMVWFGSSAGVALSNIFPEARSVGRWLKAGWFVPVAYVAGFFVMHWVHGWQPHEPHR